MKLANGLQKGDKRPDTDKLLDGLMSAYYQSYFQELSICFEFLPYSIGQALFPKGIDKTIWGGDPYHIGLFQCEKPLFGAAFHCLTCSGSNYSRREDLNTTI